jgi:PAS domain S-box-containing protein
MKKAQFLIVMSSNPISPETLPEPQLPLRAVDATPEGVIITDPRREDNPIVYANLGFMRLTGYDKREVIGRNCRFLQGPQTEPEKIEVLRDGIRQGRDAQVTVLNYRKDGTPFWNRLSVAPVVDERGDVTHHIGVQSDVSQWVEAEAILRLKERAVDATRSGVAIADARQPDYPLVYVNEAFEQMTGYSEAEVLGRNCRFLQGPDTNTHDVSYLRSAILGSEHCLVQLRNYRKDGTPFWNELSVSPVFDEQGRLTHYIGVQIDVTEFRRSEAENARLVQEVQRTAAQQRAFLRDILRSVTEGRLNLCDSEDSQCLPDTLPQPVGPPLNLTMENLRYLRRQTQQAGQEVQLPDSRTHDFIAAVGEAGMNAVVHAGGGQGRVYADPEKGRIQVWIQDRGKGIALDNLHRATLERGFSSAGTMGQGFWVMLKTADRVYLLTGAGGTTLVLEQNREAPLPPWLESLNL